MLKRLKRRLFNYLMGYLFNLITADGVIEIKHIEATKTKSKVFINGQELSEGERRELVADAKALMRVRGLEIVRKALRAAATDRLVNKSTTLEDMVAGKIMLYTLDEEESTLKRLANLSQ